MVIVSENDTSGTIEALLALCGLVIQQCLLLAVQMDISPISCIIISYY